MQKFIYELCIIKIRW